MKRLNIQINLSGELPEEYITTKWLDKIKQRILDDAKETFGEYEIWGEYFGNDDEIYAFFLRDVNINVEGDKIDGVKNWNNMLKKRNKKEQRQYQNINPFNSSGELYDY